MTESPITPAERIGLAAESAQCPCCEGSGRIDLRPMALRAAKNTITTEKGCWEYQGGKGAYPKLGERALRLAVHHLAYRLWIGVPTIGMTLHSCDNARCWNPDHLRDGDALENNTDRRRRYKTYGRAGHRNHFAKLTEANVAEIRAARDGDILRLRVAKELADRFGVTTKTIYFAAHGRTHREDTREKLAPRPHWSRRGVAPKIPRPAPGAGFKSGESHFNAKLTDKQVAKIREDGRSQSAIAEEYGVSRSTIGKIKRGERR